MRRIQKIILIHLFHQIDAKFILNFEQFNKFKLFGNHSSVPLPQISYITASLIGVH